MRSITKSMLSGVYSPVLCWSRASSSEAGRRGRPSRPCFQRSTHISVCPISITLLLRVSLLEAEWLHYNRQILLRVRSMARFAQCTSLPPPTYLVFTSFTFPSTCSTTSLMNAPPNRIAGSCMLQCSYDNVPTPPASRIKLGLSAISFPIHLPAKARKMCPCAAIKISYGSVTLPFGLPIAGSWKRFRRSAMKVSRRSVICFGDLSPRQHMPVEPLLRLPRLTPHPDIHPSKYPTPHPTPPPSSSPESPDSSHPHNPHNPTPSPPR